MALGDYHGDEDDDAGFHQEQQQQQQLREKRRRGKGVREQGFGMSSRVTLFALSMCGGKQTQVLVRMCMSGQEEDGRPRGY